MLHDRGSFSRRQGRQTKEKEVRLLDSELVFCLFLNLRSLDFVCRLSLLRKVFDFTFENQLNQREDFNIGLYIRWEDVSLKMQLDLGEA